MSKLTKCKDCGSDVSNSAKTCPKCGKKLKKGCFGKLFSFILFLFVLGAVFSLYVTQCYEEEPIQVAKKEIINTVPRMGDFLTVYRADTKLKAPDSSYIMINVISIEKIGKSKININLLPNKSLIDLFLKKVGKIKLVDKNGKRTVPLNIKIKKVDKYESNIIISGVDGGTRSVQIEGFDYKTVGTTTLMFSIY